MFHVIGLFLTKERYAHDKGSPKEVLIIFFDLSSSSDTFAFFIIIKMRFSISPMGEIGRAFVIGFSDKEIRENKLRCCLRLINFHCTLER